MKIIEFFTDFPLFWDFFTWSFLVNVDKNPALERPWQNCFQQKKENYCGHSQVPGHTYGQLEVYNIEEGSQAGPWNIAARANQNGDWSYHWVIFKDVNDDGLLDVMAARWGSKCLCTVVTHRLGRNNIIDWHTTILDFLLTESLCTCHTGHTNDNCAKIQNLKNISAFIFWIGFDG